jgi:hypothetical protein
MNDLTITAGEPWRKVIIVKDGQNVWSSLDTLEVLSQLRVGETSDSRLISNLHSFMTTNLQGNDIVITWTMTGAQTRALYEQHWGNNKTGYFSIHLSDVGVTDARALDIPTMRLKARDITTLLSGVV